MFCCRGSAHPVTVEKFDGPENVKLARHEEFDSQFLGQWRHAMLNGPLVDFLQKLPGGLKKINKDKIKTPQMLQDFKPDASSERKTTTERSGKNH